MGGDAAKNMMGSLDELEKAVIASRSQCHYGEFYNYIGLVYQLYQLNGTTALRHVDNEPS